MSVLSSQVCSATLRGVEAIPVSVEVVISSGIPSFAIVGMPDTAIQESRERIRAAIRASGYTMPVDKIVVNLAPGSLRKHGSGFDLPIALGILQATGQIPSSLTKNTVVVGELSLDGSLRSATGLLAFQICAQRQGCSVLTGTLDEQYVELPEVSCHILKNLQAARTGEVNLADAAVPSVTNPAPDFAQVHGHHMAKRALQIAAAGRHDVLMVGPPGSGKTLLARCMVGIVPDITPEEALEVALIHSVAGEDPVNILAGQRPFRSPHHSASIVGLIGGGSPVSPGEISLAHKGILFLDEIMEFQPRVLQALRQPLEEGKVRITRADGTYEFPSDFMLVAAANPCPCGYFGDAEHRCHCSETNVRAYQNRMGGPLYDRIDIRIDVWRPSTKALLTSGKGRPSAAMKEEVEAAQHFAYEREEYQSKHAATPDSAPVASLEKALRSCELDSVTEEFFSSLVQTHAMSARSALKVLRISRTIADLSQLMRVHEEHLAEACTLRFQNEMEF